MGRASKEKHSLGHRERIAAQRAAARQRQVRNRLLLAGASILTVIAVALAIVLAGQGNKPAVQGPPADGPTGTALAAVTRDLTTIPAAVLDKAGTGSLTGEGIGSMGASGGGYLIPVTGSPLTASGKPEVLYVGADFCPYCAATRWPLIIALSRFGTFSGLAPARSAVTNGAGQPEVYQATPTWSFAGSRYSSKFLAFTGVETATSTPDPKTGGYTALQSLTPGQQQVMGSHDPGQSIPFIDIGGKYVQMSSLAPYGPQSLQKLSWQQITAALRDPSTSLAKQVNASANYLTAAFCTLTANHPATACTPAVQALQPALTGAS
jgi:hypothetical protein